MSGKFLYLGGMPGKYACSSCVIKDDKSRLGNSIQENISLKKLNVLAKVRFSPEELVLTRSFVVNISTSTKKAKNYLSLHLYQRFLNFQVISTNIQLYGDKRSECRGSGASPSYLVIHVYRVHSVFRWKCNAKIKYFSASAAILFGNLCTFL